MRQYAGDPPSSPIANATPGYADAPQYLRMMDAPPLTSHAERGAAAEDARVTVGILSEGDASMDLSKSSQLIESVFAGGGDMGARMRGFDPGPPSGPPAAASGTGVISIDRVTRRSGTSHRTARTADSITGKGAYGTATHERRRKGAA